MNSGGRRPGLLARLRAAVTVGLLFVFQSAAAHDFAALQQRAMQDDTAWTLLESLTTEIGPRMAGTPADARAVAWARDRMEELGFDRVSLQPVRFPRWERRGELARIVAPRQQAMAVTALGGSPATGGVLRAEVVVFPDLAALEAVPEGALGGKIAFIAERMARNTEGSGYGATVAGRSRGPFVAAAKGAAGLLIRSVGTGNNRLPHTGMISSEEIGRPVPSAALSQPDADLLEALVERGGPVVVELDLDVGFRGEAVSHNVIGDIHGRDSEAGFIALGAHLDSWDLGTGAVDDGVGVAMTLAAARLVRDFSGGTRRGIRVVLFANEEQGVFGGKAYAEAHGEALAEHALATEADFGAGRIYRFRSRVAPGAEAALHDLERALEPLGITWYRERPAHGGADFSPMRRIGTPVIDLDPDASGYFDVHHTANDTLDKVDAETLRFNVAAYATLALWAAEQQTTFGPVAASK